MSDFDDTKSIAENQARVERENAAIRALRDRGPEPGVVAPVVLTETLIAFVDGSYKKVRPVKWRHSQWIHFTLEDGSVVRVNPANVNYLHDGIRYEAGKES